MTTSDDSGHFKVWDERFGLPRGQEQTACRRNRPNRAESYFSALLIGLVCRLLAVGHGVFASVAYADDWDEPRVVHKAVEGGGGGGHILQQFTPVLRWSVVDHDRRFVFVPPHDNLEGVCCGMFRQLL